MLGTQMNFQNLLEIVIDLFKSGLTRKEVHKIVEMLIYNRSPFSSRDYRCLERTYKPR